MVLTGDGFPSSGESRSESVLDRATSIAKQAGVFCLPRSVGLILISDNSKSIKQRKGSELVEAAWIGLRSIPPRPHHRKQRSSGVVGFVMRHGVKILPAFRISAPPPVNRDWIKGPLADAVRLLELAAQQNNSDALYLLAEMNFHGNFSHPRNLDVAFRRYHELALADGNSTAQYMVGVFYGTGIGNVVERDQAKALLYMTYAAAKGDTRAEMALGFRYHGGIGTPKSCDKACTYYKRVADKAMAWYRSGPPGGMVWVHEAGRVADEHGGVYGDGASASSAGLNAIKASVNSDANAAIDDVIEYLDLMSQKGDFKASYNLGRLYYEGQRGLEQDSDLARKYFFIVAKRYWRKDGRILDGVKPGVDKTASRAAGFIGRMYLRGEGVDQSVDRARTWFERGITQGDAQSQYGMGLILLRGLGTGGRDVEHATKLLRAAADQDHTPSQVELGILHLDRGEGDDVRMANNYFELAARWGNMEAFYYLAEMTYHGVGRDRTCAVALSYYKGVAEQAEPLVSSWAEANMAYDDGDVETALMEYLLAAEQGYERAQNNVAYLLDSTRSRRWRWSWLERKFGLQGGAEVGVGAGAGAGTEAGGRDVEQAQGEDKGRRAGKQKREGQERQERRPRRSLLDDAGLALVYWTRSSRQNNVDSLVKMGDYYYHGIGTTDGKRDVDRAVQCYTGAAEYSQSAQALFNLGWIHENGAGLKQDFHLAKRYYDHALEVNVEAYLPVALSLLKLRVRSAWNTATRGPIHSIEDEPKPGKDWSLSEWITNFLQDDMMGYEDGQHDDIFDDTIVVGLDGDGGEGIAEAEEDGGLGESLFIVGVALVLAALLYYRQQRQLAHRRGEEVRRQRQVELQQQQQQQQQQQEQQQQQQQQRGSGTAGHNVPGEDAHANANADANMDVEAGFFPPAGDPDVLNWMAGGIGH